MLSRNWIVLVALFCAACASYKTPGGPADSRQADAAEVGLRQPSPHFPANIAVARVQASQYKSHSADSYGKGRFSVMTAQELLTDQRMKAFSDWTLVEGVTTLDPLLLPPKLDSLDDLRLAAAKLQADILLVFTVDTRFQVQGQSYGPLSTISLGVVPDSEAAISSTVSAVFTDVRTGFTYGSVEATAKAAGLANAWGSSDAVDKKRLEVEHQAFTALLSDAEKTWAGITQRYQ